MPSRRAGKLAEPRTSSLSDGQRLRSISRDQGEAARGREDSWEQWCPGKQGKKPGEENEVAHSVNSC